MSGNNLKNELKFNQWRAKFLPKEMKKFTESKDLQKLLKSETNSEMRFFV